MTASIAFDPSLTLIGACAHGGVIGRDNRLPWRLPEDLKLFKATTMGHVLIMGRRTFESIGRPLPGRTTIVVSRNPEWRAEGCLHAESIDAALALARRENRGEIFVAGGADIYRQTLPVAARVLLTEIDLEVAGDAHFPSISADRWQVHSRTDMTGADGTRFAVVDYRRRD